MPADALRRALVTGATGFVGQCLVPALRAHGYDVVGTTRRPAEGFATMDVTVPRAVDATVADVRPDVVVHLAGMTYLPAVLENPKASFEVNVLGTLSLLEAVARKAPRARVLLISTCSVFGTPDAADLPLAEDAPLRSLHPYGVQKIGLEVLGDRFRSDRALDVVVARPFNHVGPGLDERLSVAFFARQIVDAERGLREPVLRVGNLTARRDFTDVRDVVRAYLKLLAQDDCPPCVHVASGRSISLSEVLDELRRRARIPLTVETDPNRLRPVDAPDLVGDAGLLRRVTGWEPVHPLAETWDRVLAHARGDDYGGPW